MFFITSCHIVAVTIIILSLHNYKVQNILQKFQISNIKEKKKPKDFLIKDYQTKGCLLKWIKDSLSSFLSSKVTVNTINKLNKPEKPHCAI